MKNKLLCLVLATLWLSSCATTHPGKLGNKVNGTTNTPVAVSARVIPSGYSKSLQLIEVTIENKSDDWLRIHRGKVLIDNPEKSKISVVVGKDLKEWAKSLKFQLMKDKHNEGIAMATLVTAGAIAAAAGDVKNDKALYNAGAIAMLSGYSWAVTDALSSAYNLSVGVDKEPESHLHSQFSLPGKMFQRRWILLNKPADRTINRLAIELETVENERSTYVVNL